jgi:hypothetical protein
VRILSQDGRVWPIGLCVWLTAWAACWLFCAAQGAASEWVSAQRSSTVSAQSRGTVQHSLHLARAAGGGPEHGEAAVSSGLTVLRWRAPDVARSEPTSSDGVIPAAFTTIRPVAEPGTAVRLASGENPSIPFADPDIVEPASAGPDFRQAAIPRELPPLSMDAQPAEKPAVRAPAPIQPTGANWQDDPAPPPQPLPPPGGESMLNNDRVPRDSCDRIYNERDCCTEELRCQTAQQFLQRDALAKISLDITPRLRPAITDPYQEESQRNQDLAQAPLRTWRDRRGNVLASGRMTNIMRGRLLVQDADNNVVKVPFHELSDDDLCFLAAWWNVPTECTMGEDVFAGRHWQPITMTWKATGACHKPLYFEEVQLERYGHTAGPIRQPILSGAHFFANLVTLPYQAGINPPWECRYALGYYRPGSCAPWLVPPVPLSVRGGLWQAGVMVGGVFLIP